MELRRAILLFAIVLGLAAIATSLSRPTQSTRSNDERGSASQPTANPGPGDRPPTKPEPPIAFNVGPTSRAIATESLKAGQAATLQTKTKEPGEVSIGGLGLTAYAEPGAPARLDVLTTVPDRYEVTFTPTRGGQSKTLGYLQVTP